MLRLEVAAVAAVACLALTGMLGTVAVMAEGSMEPSPQASDFRTLNNGSGINQYNVSYQWKYPLLEVPGRGGLDFPLTLSYKAGIGCEQEVLFPRYDGHRNKGILLPFRGASWREVASSLLASLNNGQSNVS